MGETSHKASFCFRIYPIYRNFILGLVLFQFVVKNIILIHNKQNHDPYVLLFTSMTLQSTPEWILRHLWLSTFFILFVGYISPSQIDSLRYPKTTFVFNFMCILFYIMIV